MPMAGCVASTAVGASALPHPGQARPNPVLASRNGSGVLSSNHEVWCPRTPQRLWMDVAHVAAIDAASQATRCTAPANSEPGCFLQSTINAEATSCLLFSRIGWECRVVLVPNHVPRSTRHCGSIGQSCRWECTGGATPPRLDGLVRF